MYGSFIVAQLLSQVSYGIFEVELYAVLEQVSYRAGNMPQSKNLKWNIRKFLEEVIITGLSFRRGHFCFSFCNKSQKNPKWCLEISKICGSRGFSIWPQNHGQNRARSSQNLIPVLNSGLNSLIANASWNASFSQLSLLRRILVFSRTALIWNF